MRPVLSERLLFWLPRVLTSPFHSLILPFSAGFSVAGDHACAREPGNRSPAAASFVWQSKRYIIATACDCIVANNTSFSGAAAGTWGSFTAPASASSCDGNPTAVLA
jgi:hypothetical protein